MRAFLVGCLFLVAASDASAQCRGDFNTDGVVSIDEVILSVGNALNACQEIGTRFVDNRDGTVTDHATGLVWEKKTELDGETNAANLHDADNAYNWSGVCSGLTGKRCQPNAAAATTCTAQVDGDTTGCDECSAGEGTCTLKSPAITTLWDWIAQLDTSGFAGHGEWRVPTREELRSIVDYGTTTSPAAFTAFHGPSCGSACTDITDPACSCTSLFYWSASGFAPFQGEAWEVDFNVGTLSIIDKAGVEPQPMFVRAVRHAS